MNIIFIGTKRKDGKYKIKTVFAGAPNMFGGVDAGRVFTNLYTAEKIEELLVNPTVTGVTNRPEEFRFIIGRRA